MRAFFALEVDDDLAGEIDLWRSRSLPPFSRPVPWRNFHVTLAFLGEVSPARCNALCKMADGAGISPFELRFESLGYWPRQKISYLAPRTCPAGLDGLVGRLRRTSNRLGLKMDQRKYLPHLTLARRCEAAPAPPLSAPDFRLGVSAFHLYRSKQMKTGVRYEVMASWSL